MEERRRSGRTQAAGEVVATLRTRLGALVLATVIRENVRVAEAPGHGLPVLGYAPNSAGAQDHRAAAAELVEVSVGV